MKNKFLIICFLGALLFAGLSNTLRQGDPWKPGQLMAPSKLMESIKGNAPKPVIFNIGFVNDIPGAINIGSINEKENLAKFDSYLKDLKKDTPIVIYCGCCPFDKCPNVRPAFSHLTDKGFTNHKLLNLPVSLKANWIDKGFPLKD
jgi:thiosulfate/3-mercaptopyruvate sulfurtransferase